MAEKPIDTAAVEEDINGTGEEQTGIVTRDDFTPAPIGGISGSAMDTVSFKLPRLKIAYGVGGLAAEFNQGDLVLNVGGKDGENYLLVHKEQPLQIIVLAMDTYWKEYLSKEDWDAGVRPREFLTTDEVEAVGGTWKMPPYGSGKPLPTFGGAAHIKLFVEKPEGIVCGLFGVTLKDRIFAPAVWSVDKGAFRNVASVIKNDRGFALRDRGLLSVTYTVATSVTVNPAKNRTIVTPKLRISKHHDDETIAALKDMLKHVNFDVVDEDSEPIPF